MRKPALSVKWLILLLLVLLPCTDAQSVPYVKNMHKKCLSDHQDCTKECAITYFDDIEQNKISDEAAQCAEECTTQYKVCETTLVKIRLLHERHGFTLEEGANYKPEILMEDEYAY